MIRSMTAYASAEGACDGWVLAWEIRGVNHRYLDIALRLPETLRGLEAEARARIGQAVKRGRIDATLNCKRSEQGQAEIALNRPLIENLLAALGRVEQWSGGRLPPGDALQVLLWPGALRQAETDREVLAAEALALLTRTLDPFVAGREAEGRQLAPLIEDRCRRIQDQVVAVRQRLPEVLAALRVKLLARLGELENAADPGRLEQEMVYLAQRLDVAEELDRLDGHLAEISRCLRQTDPVGRRLDFLLQELNREANTLGSKSADLETTRASVEIKVLIEQIREQVQNIE